MTQHKYKTKQLEWSTNTCQPSSSPTSLPSNLLSTRFYRTKYFTYRSLRMFKTMRYECDEPGVKKTHNPGWVMSRHLHGNCLASPLSPNWIGIDVDQHLDHPPNPTPFLSLQLRMVHRTERHHGGATVAKLLIVSGGMKPGPAHFPSRPIDTTFESIIFTTLLWFFCCHIPFTV